jgi:hypothetical protein
VAFRLKGLASSRDDSLPYDPGNRSFKIKRDLLCNKTPPPLYGVLYVFNLKGFSLKKIAAKLSAIRERKKIKKSSNCFIKMIDVKIEQQI